jgi:hypothetical protein
MLADYKMNNGGEREAILTTPLYLYRITSDLSSIIDKGVAIQGQEAIR